MGESKSNTSHKEDGMVIDEDENPEVKESKASDSKSSYY